jgi:hypothetical protein
MGTTGKFINKCEETNRQDMLQILEKWYSFEQSHSILQIVSKDDFYEDEHIQILKGFCDPNVIYYMFKYVPV